MVIVSYMGLRFLVFGSQANSYMGSGYALGSHYDTWSDLSLKLRVFAGVENAMTNLAASILPVFNWEGKRLWLSEVLLLKNILIWLPIVSIFLLSCTRKLTTLQVYALIIVVLNSILHFAAFRYRFQYLSWLGVCIFVASAHIINDSIRIRMIITLLASILLLNSAVLVSNRLHEDWLVRYKYLNNDDLRTVIYKFRKYGSIDSNIVDQVLKMYKTNSVVIPPMMHTAIPLYCDVDGTLIKSDLLFEGVFSILKRKPWKAFALPIWALRGKAFLKARVADLTDLDPSTLPYNTEFVEFLRSESAKGREIYLASASEERLVSKIAIHLGFVRGVLATARGQNLKGEAKAEAIRAHCRGESFAYAGDDRADLAVWREAAESVLVNTSVRVEKAARDLTSVVRVFHTPRVSLVTYLKAIRMHQWLKNLLVFVPLVVAHRSRNLESVKAAVAMFFAFGWMASGTYVINDLLDLSSDRCHPSKRLRPIASGQIPLATSVVIAVALLVLGAIAASLVPTGARLALSIYLVVTIAYSIHLKTVILLDALTLAGLYTLRIIGGAEAIDVTPSVWLLAFSGFLFLCLALLKRCVELDRMAQLKKTATRGRDYRVADTYQLSVMGIASGFVAVLVVALYIDSSMAAAQYRTPKALWLICPLLLYWVNRMWIKAARGEMHDDPLVYSVKDRTSWIVFALMAFTWIVAHLSL